MDHPMTRGRPSGLHRPSPQRKQQLTSCLLRMRVASRRHPSLPTQRTLFHPDPSCGRRCHSKRRAPCSFRAPPLTSLSEDQPHAHRRHRNSWHRPHAAHPSTTFPPTEVRRHLTHNRFESVPWRGSSRSPQVTHASRTRGKIVLCRQQGDARTIRCHAIRAWRGTRPCMQMPARRPSERRSPALSPRHRICYAPMWRRLMGAWRQHTGSQRQQASHHQRRSLPRPRQGRLYHALDVEAWHRLSHIARRVLCRRKCPWRVGRQVQRRPSQHVYWQQMHNGAQGSAAGREWRRWMLRCRLIRRAQ